MRLGILQKFTLTLLLTAALPLLVGVIIFQMVGQRCFLAEKGRLYETSAAYAASRLSETINDQISHFNEWLSLSDISSLVDSHLGSRQRLTPQIHRDEIARMEERWPGLEADDPELEPLLQNEIAKALRAYGTLHPLFVELLVTDSKGRLIAATDKTTDYWQADEEWWKKASHLPPDRAWVDGIHYDPSAGAYTLDVAVPLRGRRGLENAIIGVIKGVMDVNPLLASLSQIPGDEQPLYHVVAQDGKILARLFGRYVEPFSTQISAASSEQIAESEKGWMIAPLDGQSDELAGFAPLSLTGKPAGSLIVSGTKPIYVVVHEMMAVVLAPLQSQLWLFASLAVIIVVVFMMASVLGVKRQVIAPLEVLRTAAHSLSMTHGVRRLSDGQSAHVVAMVHDESVRSAVEEADHIRTGDEVEELAQEFRAMADNVLDYHGKKNASAASSVTTRIPGRNE